MVSIDEKPPMPSFEARERSRQTAYFDADFRGQTGYRGERFRLNPEQKSLNLAPEIRDTAIRYFKEKGISWHTHSNHALSSQVCCLNFLMPLARRPTMLSQVIGKAVSIPGPEMLPCEIGPEGRQWFIGFEWIGCADYLNEGTEDRRRTRGANCTSADAVVRFRGDGSDQTLLIEWKYTESYGPPIDPRGNATRSARYNNLAFAPDGPIRNDLGLALADFFYEPFYQLLRQQMLAFQMRKAKEGGSTQVRVLHIAPAANIALRKVTSPSLRRFGDDAFAVFRSLLVHQQDFIGRSTETLFGPLVSNFRGNDWADYLARRYTFLAEPITDIERQQF
jgi:hypothetical protein